MLPAPTARLRFHEMSLTDLPNMTQLLGDPRVMAFYPAPKTPAEARRWIEWNVENYAAFGHGLWVIELLNGTFVGDCGLTWQKVNGTRRIEVGYHVLPEFQGQGLATEAAMACREFARTNLGVTELIALVAVDNRASQRVAEKLGMRWIEDDYSSPQLRRAVWGMSLTPQRVNV